MKVSLTKSEVQTIREIIKSQTECERDAITCFPEHVEVWRQKLRDWKSIRKKLKPQPSAR